MEILGRGEGTFLEKMFHEIDASDTWLLKAVSNGFSKPGVILQP